MQAKSEMARRTPLARSGGLRSPVTVESSPSTHPTFLGLCFSTGGPVPTKVVVALALSLGGKLRAAVRSWIIYETR